MKATLRYALLGFYFACSVSLFLFSLFTDIVSEPLQRILTLLGVFMILSGGLFTRNSAKKTDDGFTQLQREQIEQNGIYAWYFQSMHANVQVADKTEIQFTSNSNATVVSSLPLPTNRPIYFEAKVLECDSSTILSIGLVNSDYPHNEPIGFLKTSIAYRSDGCLGFNGSIQKVYPDFSRSSVVGCGINVNGQVFFTNNAAVVGRKITVATVSLFPAITASGPCRVLVNFGTGEFLWRGRYFEPLSVIPVSVVLPRYSREIDSRERLVLIDMPPEYDTTPAYE